MLLLAWFVTIWDKSSYLFESSVIKRYTKCKKSCTCFTQDILYLHKSLTTCLFQCTVYFILLSIPTEIIPKKNTGCFIKLYFSKRIHVVYNYTSRVIIYFTRFRLTNNKLKQWNFNPGKIASCCQLHAFS